MRSELDALLALADMLPGLTEDEARHDVMDAQRIIEAIRQFLAGHV